MVLCIRKYSLSEVDPFMSIGVTNLIHAYKNIPTSSACIYIAWLIGVGRGKLNRPFYSCGFSTLASEWTWGWDCPCFDTNLFPFLIKVMIKKGRLLKNNMIYLIKEEGLHQNKVNCTLVSTCNCKMGYTRMELRKRKKRKGNWGR